MLVLSRKPNERILIGEDIALTVVRIGPNTVRIGIDAPKDVTIRREEVPLKEEGGETKVEKDFAPIIPNS